MKVYDAAIVGAGPAGMAATTALCRMGASVLVIDEGATPGGQVWRCVDANVPGPLAAPLGADYAQGIPAVAAFRASGADYRPETQVWQIEDGWRLFLTSGGRTRIAQARTVLLATGALERPVPFPGWTLPGVMTVGAAQILLKSAGLLPDGPLWIAGSGPLPLLYAAQLLELGGRVAGFLDTTPRPGISALRHLPQALRDVASLRKGLEWKHRLRRSSCRIIGGVSAIAAEGEGRLQRVRWTAGKHSETAEAGVLLVHEGIVPQIHASLALGCIHDWRPDQGCLVPRLDEWGQTSRPGLFVAGDAAGIGGWAAAALGGEIAALGIARHLRIGSDIEARRKALHRRQARTLAIRPLLDALYPPPRWEIADETIVCRCEEVTAGAIRAAAQAAAPDPNAVKAATRAGMGPCQGRQCGYAVQALIAEAHGIDLGKVGFFNIRPPLKPVTLGELAGLAEPENAA